MPPAAANRCKNACQFAPVMIVVVAEFGREPASVVAEVEREVQVGKLLVTARVAKEIRGEHLTHFRNPDASQPAIVRESGLPREHETIAARMRLTNP